MNKKILISLCVIAAVAALAIGGTIAYFSDVETSTGNTFTAGSLDLIVDIDGTDQNPLVDKLFDLPDMKPGDLGEKTISLKVDDNPACGFVNINITDDNENTCTEPETVAEPTCTPNTQHGELNDEVQFAVWADTDCDNVFDPGETPLVQGPLTGDHEYSIGELPLKDTHLPHDGAMCYGIGYCFGSWVTHQVGDVIKVKCDGSAIGNRSQSDSFTGDIIITAQQKRNQYPDGCPVVGEL